MSLFNTEFTVWQIVAALALSTFLVSSFSFVTRRLTLRGGRIVARIQRTAPRLDPHSGRPGWPIPEKTPTSLACYRPGVFRLLMTGTLCAGFYYMQWRWQVVNWNHWWVGLPLVVAETHFFLEVIFSTITFWRLRAPEPPPPPLEGATVDVFICTYNEPLDLVRGTVRAAKEIRYPHQTWVLDDGNRPAFRQMAEEEGVGYINRSRDWDGRNRHAKAGNISNALMQTSGEFILFQDADQIPSPEIVDHLIGYFADPEVGFVQSPHWFYNVHPDDPLGAQDPIFYGPVLQGKSEYNAAFFCGSNGMIRREAMLQAGARHYAHVMEQRVREAVRAARPMLGRALKENRRADYPSPTLEEALLRLQDAVEVAAMDLKAGLPLQELTFRFQDLVRAINRELVQLDLTQIRRDLRDVGALVPDVGADVDLADPRTVDSLLRLHLTPLEAFHSVTRLVELLDLHRNDEALPILGFSTIAVTEDMATALRMHAQGWKSVYRHEIMARALSPDDARSACLQRQRWAQGAFQTCLRQSLKGLGFWQKVLYSHSFIYYTTGLSLVVLLLAPAAYLLFGQVAIAAPGLEMAIHFVPYFLIGQIAFRFWTSGLDTWRCQQWAAVYFPVWIKALLNAVREHLGLTQLKFDVTPKEVQEGIYWRDLRWQLAVLGLVTVSLVVGLGRILLGWDPNPAATFVNVLWAWFDVALLSVVLEAAVYRPPVLAEDAEPTPALAEARPAALAAALVRAE